METKFNFNSAICTSREQSEKLLALGLKKETADCYYFYCDIAKEWKCTILSSTQVFKDYPTTVIPAWSLHRLIEMMPQCIYHKNRMCFLFIDQSVYVQYRHSLYGASQTIVEQFMKSNLWDNLIDGIEWLIKEGDFNKEYLTGN